MATKPSAMRNRFIVQEISTFAVVSEKYFGIQMGLEIEVFQLSVTMLANSYE